ncbi:MAG: hypothetical protein II008_04255, partial [Oscillospiraceae bacterium]|nr:hypothetical protein [Oscillospiraceae bacterium]
PELHNILKGQAKVELPRIRTDKRVDPDWAGVKLEVPETVDITNNRAEKMLKVIGQIAKEDPHSAADLLAVLVERDML